MTEKEIREAVVEAMEERVVRYLSGEDGAVEERVFRTHFASFRGEPLEATLKALGEAGQVRRVRCPKTGLTVVALTRISAARIRREATRREGLRRALEEERRAAQKPSAEEYGTDTGSYRLWTEELKAGRVRGEDLPFRVRRERDELPVVRNGRPWKDRPVAGENRYSAAALEERFGGDHLDNELRSRVEVQSRTGAGKKNAARAYVRRVGWSREERILTWLRRFGGRREEKVLFYECGVEDPVDYGRAIRVLAEAGKIRRLRNKSTGEALVALPRRRPDGGRPYVPSSLHSRPAEGPEPKGSVWPGPEARKGSRSRFCAKRGRDLRKALPRSGR